MDSHILSIVVVVLILVIILHFINKNNDIGHKEGMDRLSNDIPYNDMKYTDKSFTNELSTNKIKKRKKHNKKLKNYDDGVYRDPGTSGLDRMDNSKPWYHVVNRLVTNDRTRDHYTCDDTDSSDSSDSTNNDKTDKNTQKYIKSLRDHIRSNKEKYSNLNINQYKNNENDENNEKIKNNKCRTKHNIKKKLVFDDNYEGVLTWRDMNREQKFPTCAEQLQKCNDVNAVNADAYADDYVDVFGVPCSTAKSSCAVKEYIRNVVLDGNTQCGCVVDKSKSDFTRDEVNEYRESQLRFRDKINGTSSPAIDPVDRINLITLHEGIKARGQTIADVYDNIITG